MATAEFSKFAGAAPVGVFSRGTTRISGRQVVYNIQSIQKEWESHNNGDDSGVPTSGILTLAVCYSVLRLSMPNFMWILSSFN